MLTQRAYLLSRECLSVHTPQPSTMFFEDLFAFVRTSRKRGAFNSHCCCGDAFEVFLGSKTRICEEEPGSHNISSLCSTSGLFKEASRNLFEPSDIWSLFLSTFGNIYSTERRGWAFLVLLLYLLYLFMTNLGT